MKNKMIIEFYKLFNHLLFNPIVAQHLLLNEHSKLIFRKYILKRNINQRRWLLSKPQVKSIIILTGHISHFSLSALEIYML
jgi:hypothetical protein